VVEVVDYLSLDGGIVVLSLPHMQEWFGRAGATWLEVQLAPGADAGAVRRALTAVVAGFPGDVRVNSGEEERRGGQDAARQASAVALAIQWMIAVTAGLTMLNTLLLAVVERRRELAVLRALGATRRRVRRVVAVEAAALAVLGCLAGIVLAVPLQYCLAEGLSRAAAVSVGLHPVAPSLPLVLAVFLVAVLAPVLPAARQAARTDLALALQEE
jgi:putative ABC transport system permease protein